MNGTSSAARLLDGPDPQIGSETLSSHLGRLGPMRRTNAPAGVISEIELSGLLGRGGAAFPVGTKWRHVAERRRTGAVVVANGAEGEPRSLKDRTLMSIRPHLVIDGAVLAARAVAADEVILYVGSEHTSALSAMSAALGERQDLDGVPISLVAAPPRYVSGESSAVVHYLNEQDARPLSVPPRPWQHGVRGAATIVQNVESLAHAALIGRFGAEWYRSLGRGATKGTALTTVIGASANPVVREIEIGTPLRELVANAGGEATAHEAVLLGGYFGGWSLMSTVIDRRLDPVDLKAVGSSLGCGLVALLPYGSCGVRATASILRYMASESARQCGPCIFGLGAIASASQRLATTDGSPMDLANLQRWASMVRGRGACHHPDGAAGLVESSLRTFGHEYELHARRRCSRPAHGLRAA
jgi:NADH:ubiquinone oxidoreductase subunit F (NADH-binding)